MNTIYNHYIASPIRNALNLFCVGCFGSCYTGRGPRTSSRTSSTPRSGYSQVFFDMYEEDEFGRDELERLLAEEEDEQEFGEFHGAGAVSSTSGHEVESSATTDGQNGLETGEWDTRLSMGLSRGSSWHSRSPKFSHQVHNYLAQFLPSIFEPKLTYRPSAAGLRVRERSSTKSSIESSDTYRSRTELLSDGDHEDAQLVGDIDAALTSYDESYATDGHNEQGPPP